MSDRETFVKALDTDLQDRAGQELSDDLQEILVAAQTAWPQVSMDTSAFLCKLARCTRVEEGVLLLPIFSADLWLATACADGDEKALAIFESEFAPLILSTLGRLSLQASDCDEIHQDLRVKLLIADEDKPAKIHNFQGHGPLRAWLKTIAARAGLLLLRSRKNTDHVAVEDVDLAHYDDSFRSLKTKYATVFKGCFQAALNELEPRERNLLRAQGFEGLSVNEIAARYQVHRVSASRWFSLLRHKLLTSTTHKIAQELGLNPVEVSDLLELIQSQLDASISRVLGHTPETEPM